TRSCTGCAAPEEYREFKLVNWFITTPIKIVRADCDNCLYLREEHLRTKSNLDLNDFGNLRAEKISMCEDSSAELRALADPDEFLLKHRHHEGGLCHGF